MWLKNVGSNENPLFKRPEYIKDGDGTYMNIGHHVCMPILVDWDKTGKNDILISGESGMFYFFRHNYLNGIYKSITYDINDIK